MRSTLNRSFCHAVCPSLNGEDFAASKNVVILHLIVLRLRLGVLLESAVLGLERYLFLRSYVRSLEVVSCT